MDQRQQEEMIRNFMKNRNGLDELTKFFFWVGVILCCLTFAIPSPYRWYVLGGGLICFIYCLFRIFSTRFYARQKENDVYLKIINFFKFKKKEPRYVLDSTNPLKIIAKCPKCKQRMRLPNKEGKHTVTCPKCNKQFKLKIK
jgi:hypothetical protein